MRSSRASSRNVKKGTCPMWMWLFSCCICCHTRRTSAAVRRSSKRTPAVKILSRSLSCSRRRPRRTHDSPCTVPWQASTSMRLGVSVRTTLSSFVRISGTRISRRSGPWRRGRWADLLESRRRRGLGRTVDHGCPIFQKWSRESCRTRQRSSSR